MRTTVEISDDYRARLHSLSTKRGEKGFSRLIQEALEMFFEAQDRREEKKRAALAAIGSFDEASADELERSVRQLRNSWR